MAAFDAVVAFPFSSKHSADNSPHRAAQFLKPTDSNSSSRNHLSLTANYSTRRGKRTLTARLSSPSPPANANTKLYVTGLSFRTTEDGLRTVFQSFGQLLEVNLVMDKIANRPRGFAFLRYATEEESKKAISGMHGKFLDGRVIFVEVAKPRSELRKCADQNPRLYQ